MAVEDAVQDWRQEARELSARGISGNQIADALGKARSSVQSALKETTVDETQINGQRTIDGREVYDTVPPPEEIVLAGTQQLSIDFGGKRPQSAVITFTGGKAKVDGFFRKGDRLVVQCVAVIRGEGADDKVDKQTGQVVDSVAKYRAEILDMTLVD